MKMHKGMIWSIAVVACLAFLAWWLTSAMASGATPSASCEEHTATAQPEAVSRNDSHPEPSVQPAIAPQEKPTSRPITAPLSSAGIKTGFAFVDGQYVPPPYVVEIQDDTVTLNGHVTYKIWQPSKSLLDPNPTRGVKIPASITRKTTVVELATPEPGTPGFLFAQWNYLSFVHDPKTAHDKMLTYIRSLPCVKNIVVTGKSNNVHRLIIEVTTHDGKSLEFYFLPRPAQFTPKTKEEIAEKKVRDRKRLENEKASTETMLSHSNTIFYWRKSFRQSWGKSSTADRLRMATKIPSMSISAKEKEHLLRKLELYSFTKRFADNFQPSAELDQRLEELQKRTGTVPMTFEKLKAMPTREELEEQSLLESKRKNEERRRLYREKLERNAAKRAARRIRK